MRRKPSGPRVLYFFWVACLFAPPTVRLWLDVSRAPGPGDPAPSMAERPEVTVMSGAASGDLVTRLRAAERDLRALDVTLVSEEYEPVLARVLALDPSTNRHALLVGIRSRKPVPSDITAITADHRLLGRVLDVVDPPLDFVGFAVAQIQTLRDKAFRVRFVAGETRGLAAGTGETTEDGHPLLEILFLDDHRQLEDGEVVRTDATGGVFAPGIPIGSVLLEAGTLIEKRRNRLPVIRSEITVSPRGQIIVRQGRVILLRDSMRLSAAQVTRTKS